MMDLRLEDGMEVVWYAFILIHLSITREISSGNVLAVRSAHRQLIHALTHQEIVQVHTVDKDHSPRPLPFTIGSAELPTDT